MIRPHFKRDSSLQKKLRDEYANVWEHPLCGAVNFDYDKSKSARVKI